MGYETQNFKIPSQSDDYPECSRFVTTTIEAILKEVIDKGENKIFINTNLKRGLPMENINKVAGPFLEAWAAQTFDEVLKDTNNKYQLIHVEVGGRLHIADVVLQFQKQRKVESGVTAEVDVKATAEDIESSGKAPNITSYARIRTAYIENPDYVFIILSLKHRVYSTRKKTTGLMDGIMEVMAYHAYDLKYLSSKDVDYNPALGTGQIQVRNIHDVELQERTTWEFCQLLDRKYLQSARRSFGQWLKLAKKNGWIRSDD